MATVTPGVRLEFYTDPSAFLAAAGEWLSADPLISTVVTTAAHRAVAQVAERVVQPDRNWWLVVRDDSGVVHEPACGQRRSRRTRRFCYRCRMKPRWPWPARCTSAAIRCSRSMGHCRLPSGAPSSSPGLAGAVSRSPCTPGCTSSASLPRHPPCPAGWWPPPRTTWSWSSSGSPRSWATRRTGRPAAHCQRA